MSTHQDEPMGEGRHAGRHQVTTGAELPTPLQGCHNTPATGPVPVLAEVKPLPGSQCQMTMTYRQGQRWADQYAFYVSVHIVRPLHHMLVVRRILRHHDIEVAFQITPYIRVSVFIHRQGCRGVLDEQVQ